MSRARKTPRVRDGVPPAHGVTPHQRAPERGTPCPHCAIPIERHTRTDTAILAHPCGHVLYGYRSRVVSKLVSWVTAARNAARALPLLPGVAPVCFVIPVRTHAEKSTREHWTSRVKRVREQRQYAYMRLLWATHGHRIPLPATVRLIRVAPRALDDGDTLAMSLSAIRDGIADGFGLASDSAEGLRWEYAEAKSQQAHQYTVCVSITRPVAS